MATGAQGIGFSVQSITLSASPVTLSPAGIASSNLKITGTLSGNASLIFPNVSGFWFVDTTAFDPGLFVATFSSGSGSFSPILAGQIYLVVTNGSNFISVK